MSAQPATATILAYGPQGTQQSAAAALLSYSPPPGAARRVVATFGAPWAQSAPQAAETHSPMHHSDALDAAARAPWGEGAPQHREARTAWVPTAAADRERSAPWQRFASRLQPQAAVSWGVARQQDAAARHPWGRFAGRPALAAQAAWLRAVPSDPQATAPWGQYASRPVLLVRPVWALARQADAQRWIPWTRYSRALQPGWGVVTPDGRPPVDEHGTIVVPVRTVYMTTNTITLTRVSDGAAIHAYTFGMGLDVDSWTWSWQAQLHASALPLIQPGPGGDPVEVLATINGTPYRLALESFARERSFGSTRISVKGRGRAAILDAPYAPVLNHGNAAARTLEQLMGDVLTINGVGIGWDVDFGITDWLVPGGAWTHQGSYISALLDMADAAGAYLQPHDTAATLRVLPRYPAAPWQWHALAPDFELPSAVVAVEGIEWQRKAAYNRVHVTGTSAGVLGEVTRGGTAGDAVAPMVTHPLITHADAARQRGLAVLGDTGTQARISLRLPVLEETGVIKPGALVRYVDGATTHLGLVRSTAVEWAAPQLRQVLAVETHPA
ncbi:MAG: hypothetical protein RBS27_01480 [Giesbergeria sp.]|jgi:hypothetical protein|nr:hypothetical protein [Giesbergeria sp.]